MYKGITTCGDTPTPYEVFEEIVGLPMPTLQPWQNIAKPNSTFLWSVKPPGEWITLLRYDELLVTSDPNIPLEVDYEHVYAMLAEHKSALLARLDPEVGLIGVAARKPKQPFTPLMPGFSATAMIDPRTLDTTGVEQLSEKDHDWPEGLQKPSIIGMQAAFSLNNPVHRADWLEKYPEGIWLMNATSHALLIYEVLS